MTPAPLSLKTQCIGGGGGLGGGRIRGPGPPVHHHPQPVLSAAQCLEELPVPRRASDQQWGIRQRISLSMTHHVRMAVCRTPQRYGHPLRTLPQVDPTVLVSHGAAMHRPAQTHLLLVIPRMI